MNWRPVIHSRSLVEIPEVFIQYDPAALEDWIAAQSLFEQSGRKNYSQYGADYGRLAEEGRFLLPYPNAPKKRFFEFHTALLLDREGFDCWGQVQLFDDPNPLFVDGQPVRGGKGYAVRNTRHIMDEMGWAWRWPSAIQQSLDFQPRNPDIVAYRKGKWTDWRFCEVKGPGDSCSGDHFTEQLRALAVLHLLTGSPVAIVRPLEQGRRPNPAGPYQAELKYKRGARLDWMRRVRSRVSRVS